VYECVLGKWSHGLSGCICPNYCAFVWSLPRRERRQVAASCRNLGRMRSIAMGFYEWRLMISLATAAEARQQKKPATRPSYVRTRLQRIWRSFWRNTGSSSAQTTSLVAVVLAALISLATPGLADTLDTPSQFGVLGGSAPCLVSLILLAKRHNSLPQTAGKTILSGGVSSL